jgi:hypothetical protein
MQKPPEAALRLRCAELSGWLSSRGVMYTGELTRSQEKSDCEKANSEILGKMNRPFL